MPSIESTAASLTTPNLHSNEPNQTESSTTSVNGESVVSTADTPNSSTVDDQASSPVKKVFVPAPPPKVNVWKVRAEQTSVLPHNGTSTEVPVKKAHLKEQVKEQIKETGPTLVGEQNGTVPCHQKELKATKAAPQIDDVGLWPSLDKAVEEPEKEASVSRSAASGTSAPKISGKEKWVKYTPIITHTTPLPPKGSRGGSNARGGRGGPVQRSRTQDAGLRSVEGDEAPRSLRGESTRGRINRPRAMSVTGPPYQQQRRESVNGQRPTSPESGSRSSGARRAEKESTAAAVHSEADTVVEETPTFLASHNNGFATDTNEQKPIRDAASSRGRGGYRGRGMYANNNGNHMHHNSGNYQGNSPNYSRHYRNGSLNNGNYRAVIDQYQYGYYDPSMSVAPIPMYDPNIVRQMVLGQIEYYFSIENLCKDLFLRKHMDGEGFVNLPILANFNRVRAITLDYALLRDVCAISTIVEFRVSSGAFDKVRLQQRWEQWVLPEGDRDPSTKMIPPPQPDMSFEAVQSEIPENRAGLTASSVDAPAFVPGMVAPPEQQNMYNLNENFATMGLGRKLSPDVADFQPSMQGQEKATIA